MGSGSSASGNPLADARVWVSFLQPQRAVPGGGPKPLNVEQLKAAKQLGVLLKRLNEIVFGKPGIILWLGV